MSDEPYYYDYQEYESEAEPQPRNRRLLWMGGVLVAVLLVACLCCCCVTAAFFAGREVGLGAGQPEAEAPQAMPPQAMIVYPTEALVGQPAQFDGSGSQPGTGAIVSYEWDFGDGTQGTGAVVIHAYGAAGIYRVTLRVTAEDGLSGDSAPVEITIKAPESPTSTPTPAAAQPAIQSFTATPAEVKVGECVNLVWSTSDTSAVQIQRNGQVVVDNGIPVGQQSDCPDQIGSHVYRLDAYGSAGGSVSQEQSVNVVEAQAPPPLAGINWQLTAMNGAGLPDTSMLITAMFGTDGNVTGFGGCNTYGGSYTLEGSNLSVGPLTGGDAACGAEIDQLEQSYLQSLQSAATFEISGNELIVRDGAGMEVLRYMQSG